jgi:hypothetical protein
LNPQDVTFFSRKHAVAWKHLLPQNPSHLQAETTTNISESHNLLNYS